MFQFFRKQRKKITCKIHNKIINILLKNYKIIKTVSISILHENISFFFLSGILYFCDNFVTKHLQIYICIFLAFTRKIFWRRFNGKNLKHLYIFLHLYSCSKISIQVRTIHFLKLEKLNLQLQQRICKMLIC